MKKKLDHKLARGLGFRNLQHMFKEIAGADISTKPRLKRFKHWKRHDGSFEGLQRLGEIRHLENWPTRLHDFIESRRKMPFQWAKHDCCLFACDAVLATTGIDPAAGLFRGKYKDALGAARLVKRHGGIERIAANVCKRLEFGEIRVTMAQRGDVMIYLDAGEPVLGVCLGRVSAFVAPEGLRFVPTLSCSRAWKIGGNA